MDSLIGHWVGQMIALTLRVGGIGGAVMIEGRLVTCRAVGVLLELSKGQTFDPVTSILHLSRQNTK